MTFSPTNRMKNPTAYARKALVEATQFCCAPLGLMKGIPDCRCPLEPIDNSTAVINGNLDEKAKYASRKIRIRDFVIVHDGLCNRDILHEQARMKTGSRESDFSRLQESSDLALCALS